MYDSCYNLSRHCNRIGKSAGTAIVPAAFLRITVCIYFLFISIAAVRAQADSTHRLPEYMNYKWDSLPRLHTLTDSESKMSAVIIKDKMIIEYYYEKPGEISMYVTVHRIIRVNSSDAIDNYNTVYLSMGDVSNVLSLQARSIGKNGKVTPLNKANIKDVDNYSNLGPYKIFAIDGIEAGGEVEYLYTLREPFKLTNAEYIRGKTLIKDYELEIYSPPDLVFEAKSYNGFPEMKTDTAFVGKNRIYAQANDIAGRKQEDFSAGDACQMRMEYKFTYNANLNPSRALYTYDDFCAKMFELIDQSASKKDRRTAVSFADSLNLKNLPSEGEKIAKIDRSIKNLIGVTGDAAGDKYLSVADIIKGKVTNELGIIKLYYLIFEAEGIQNEIVATTDRFTKTFDPDFESWASYLQKYLFYFPRTGQYLSPAETLSRYGYPPSGWLCQKGLFIHAVSLGKYNTGVGEIKEISCSDWRQNMNGIYANMKFDTDMSAVKIHYRETMTGYEINEYGRASMYGILSEKDKSDFVSNFLKVTFPDAKPTHDTVLGCEEHDSAGTPFSVSADFSTESILEESGDKYIFKIGLVIGPQSELYLDTLRQSPVMIQYNHGYHRTLILHVPTGYKVTNLDALNMEVSDKPDTTRTMEFHSGYSIAGDSIVVNIIEDYRQISYPISMYGQFRDVINASADFNKVVLFLEKK